MKKRAFNSKTAELAKFFGRLKPGHGSKSSRFCNIQGCTKENHPGHYQNSYQEAENFLNGKKK